MPDDVGLVASEPFARPRPTQHWLRGPAAHQRDANNELWIVLDPHRATSYLAPPDETHSTLLFDLANIDAPHHAMPFIAQYGLLWHGPEADVFQEPFSAWWKEVHDLHHSLRLYSAMHGARAGDRAKLRELRGWFGRKRALRDREVLARASELLAERVSAKLIGAGIRLAADVDPVVESIRFVLGVSLASPLPRAYFQFAHLLQTSIPVAICPDTGCARFFAVTDPRQHYCSAACANRARQRRWAARARGELTTPPAARSDGQT